MSDPPPAPLKILEVEAFGRGGLAHYVANLSRALAARGHEVTVATASGYELGEPPATTPEVHIVPTFARASHRLRASLPAVMHALLRKVEAVYDGFAVAALARRLRPDVVHLHSTRPIAALYAFLLATGGRPLVTTAHVVLPHEPLPLQHPIYRSIYRRSRLVIAHSEFDRRRLERELEVDPRRIEVVAHGEYGFFAGGPRRSDRGAARRTLGLRLRDEVALFFGYIREYKGLDVLLDAWPDVARTRPAARLVVAGDPVQLGRVRRQRLETRAESLGAVARFEYVPFAEVETYFAAADVLVMPYRSMSQSGVLYLALALGLPVVATRVGPLPEMLRDGESALLVPPEAPRDLALALERALGDADLRERLARGGRRLADRHSWPTIAGRTERAFARLIDLQRESS